MSRSHVCNVLRVRYIGTQPPVAAGPCVKITVRMWIVRIALNRPYTFVVLALLILGIGPLTIARTPTDIFPNIDIPVVSVIWNYGGLSAQDMADRIISNFQRALTTPRQQHQHLPSPAPPG